MSTALAIRSQTAVATQDAPSMSFTDMLAMGNELVRTGFLPDHVKNGAQAAAIILAGRELGMPPMRSLRSIFLVKGKITESADSQLARFKTDGGRAKFTTLDDTRAVLWLKHPNGDEHTESFTMEDAKRAGLVSSGMYSKFSKAMLRSRAITAGLKSVGWEGGAGAYDPDELAAPSEPESTEDVTTETPSMTLANAEDMKVRGKPLRDIKTPRLQEIRTWAADNDNATLVLAADIVLASREDAELSQETDDVEAVLDTMFTKEAA